MPRLNLITILAACLTFSVLTSALPTKRSDPVVDTVAQPMSDPVVDTVAQPVSDPVPDEEEMQGTAISVARDSLRSSANFFDDMNEMWKADRAEKMKGTSTIKKFKDDIKAAHDIQPEESSSIESATQPTTHSATHPATHSTTHPATHSATHPATHSAAPSSTHSATHTSSHSPPTHSPTHSPLHPPTHSPTAQPSHIPKEGARKEQKPSVAAAKTSESQEPEPEKEITVIEKPKENAESPPTPVMPVADNTKPSRTETKPSPAASSGLTTPVTTHEVKNNFFSKLPVVGKLLSGGGLT